MKFIRRFVWVWVACLIIFIFANSLTPAVSSKEMSSELTLPIHQFLISLNVHIDFELLHYLVRKFAHFVEYALLGSLLYLGVSLQPLISSKLTNFTLFLLTPVIDETIQWFTPGRSCEVTDMLLDISGMLTGALFLFIVGLVLMKKQTKHHLD